MQLPIASGAYKDVCIDINNQNCINWIPANSGPQGRGSSDDGQSYKSLIPTSGSAELINLNGLKTRNLITVRDNTYAVIDNDVYRLEIDNLSKTVTSSNIVGTLNTSSGVVRSAYNPTQIMFADGDGYIYTDSPNSPTVTSLSPSTGAATGSTSITITGTNFTSDSTVTVGGVAATGVVVNSATSITATTPAYVSGALAKSVRVTNYIGTGYLGSAFTYTAVAPTISALSPSTGATAGKTLITITGTNFVPGMSVSIGGAAATNVVTVNSTTLTCVTAAGVAGTYNTQITNSAGSATLNSSYTYNSTSAVIGSISPVSASVSGGGTISISGTNLTGYSTVRFNGTSATNVTVVSDTLITADIPAYASGINPAYVLVFNGTNNGTLYASFTYSPSTPTISSIAPTTGFKDTYTPVTITGTNFTPDCTVTINGAAALSTTITNSTSITCVFPPNAITTSLVADVQITNSGGTGSTTSAFAYTDGVFTEITSSGFSGASQVVFVDGYFIASQPSSGRFNFSDLNDGINWDASAVATAESSPDNIVALGVCKGELWVLGEVSTEIWYNAGNNSGAPFSPRTGLELQIGCQAEESVINLNDLLIWVDNRGYVVQSDVSPYLRSANSGYQLQIISTDALTQEILNYTVVSDAVAITYNDRGHLMYQVSFPTQKKTWVFDYLTKQWHERLYYSEFDGEMQHHLGQYCTQYKNLTIIGGVRSGKLYLSSPEYTNDDGVNIRRLRTTAFLYDRENVRFISIAQLALRIGQIIPTPVSGDYSDPLIGLRYSKDGGHTWSDRMWRSLGETGDYLNIITWNRLGNSRLWLFEFLISDPVSVSLIDAWLNAEAEQ